MDAKTLLKALRARLGLTQEQLAEKAELLRQEINKIEIGKNQVSTIRLIRALAKAAEASLEDMAAYFAEEIDLNELFARIDARKAAAAQDGARSSPDATRELAAEICKLGGVMDEAVLEVLKEPPARRTTLEWIERMRLKELELRRGRPHEPAAKRRA